MKKITFLFALLCVFTVCNSQTKQKTNKHAADQSKPTASAAKNLKIFPAAVEGMERYVIMLDSLGSNAEYEYQIELIPGKMMEVDCNKHFLMGEITEKNLEGYGYNYYEFTSKGDARSTLMACPDGKKTNSFVHGHTLKVRYNSLLPIVVFVPEGFELKYKIWSAGELKAVHKL